ncbi:hypothetical protein ACGFNU_02355 [Spirillospora sp. NPDC048911]|uniref:hypothetical protein n=1 Tax=Spirillospora sp. NPDC048911 TaxID=3364527 RepID=UPI0037223B2B
MLRLRLRNGDPEPSRHRGRPLETVLVVVGAGGAAAIAATHPAIGFSLNVGATVLAALYAVTSRPAQIDSDENEPADSEGDQRADPGEDQQN